MIRGLILELGRLPNYSIEQITNRQKNAYTMLDSSYELSLRTCLRSIFQCLYG